MSQYPPNPNNPYGQNPSDPNYNQGTAYGGGPPSGPGPEQGPNPYNPYSNNPPAPSTNPNPYGPYGMNPPTPAPPPNTGYPPNDPYAQTVASTNPNFNQYTGAPPAPPTLPFQPPTAPVRPRKGPSMRVILIAAIALLLIIGGIVIALVSYTNTQQGYTNATATAHANATATFNVTATAIAHANATATANAIATANANATATALVTSQYQPFTNLALHDSLLANSSAAWNTGSTCQFTPTGYQVSIAQSGFYEACFAASTDFSDFAYQVDMTIVKGDCGGLVFRAVDNQNFYTFFVCQDGKYQSILFVKNANAGSTTETISSAIHTGFNQVNRLAVVLQGNTINLYANGQSIHNFTDPTFTHGSIGVLANDVTVPTVVNYTNAVVWTAS